MGKSDPDPRDLLAIYDHGSLAACAMRPMRRGGRLVDLRLVSSNRAFAKLIGIAGFDSLEGSLLSEAAPTDAKAVIMSASKVLESGKARKMRLHIAASSSWVLCSLARSGSGNLIATFAESGEGEKLTAKAAKRSVFRNFFETGGIKLIIRSSDGRILAVNRAASDYYGWSAREMKAMTIFQVDESPARAVELTMASIDARGLSIFTTCHRRARGDSRSVEVHSYVGRYDGGLVHFAVVLDRPDPQCLSLPEDEPASMGRSMPAGKADFKPFIARYECVLPYVRELVGQILPYGRLIGYERGEHFLEYGEISPNVGFVLKGIFRQYTIDPEGRDCSLRILKAGEVLYIDPRGPSESGLSFALEAMDECRVFVLDIRHFGAIVDGDIRWSKLFYRSTMETVASMSRREYSLLCEDAAARFRRFAAEEPEALEVFLGYKLASYLGVTSETLSRIRKPDSKKARKG